MSEIVGFLSTPGGQEFTHALVVLIVAVSGWINWRTNRTAKRNGELLNGHLERHIEKSHNATSSGVEEPPHNI